MSEKTWIEQVVEKVVQEVLESHVSQLRTDLVRRVLEEIGPQLAASPENTPASLLKAISAIQTGSTQREILRSLLDHAARYSGRAALFVIKAGAATGWQGRGFSNYEDIKDLPLDVHSGIAARTMQSRIPFAGSSSELDPRFVSKFGAPADDRVLLLPLLLKERVAALVYVDAGIEAGGKMDAAALEVLVVSASAWLEVAALRKQSHKESGSEAATAEKARLPGALPTSSLPTASPSPSFADPFASHAPMHSTELTPEPAVEPAIEYPAAISAVAIAEAEPGSANGAAAAMATDPFSAMAPEDAEIHRKAQRFARLLVDEIKLYNQAKVAEGRKNKDLYDRLKDDIDKSQATYQKRYGSTVAANAVYFSNELVRSLAEDDSSLMGVNFQR
jgi:hypothetical protein